MNHILIALVLTAAPPDNDAVFPSWAYACWEVFETVEDWLPAWEAQVCGLNIDDEIFGKGGKYLGPIWTPPAELTGPQGHAKGSPGTAGHSTLPDWSRDSDVPRDVSRVD